MTAAALLAEAAAALAVAGVPSPEWDAERLLLHVLGADRARLVADRGRLVPADAEDRFRRLVARRAAREPLQHIVGTQAFWRSEFLVTPDVLVPRPETELLVETALEVLRGVERPIVVDVGTGSGCIALSIAAERPDAVVYGTDISRPALEVAFQNRKRQNLEERVALLEGHLLAPLAALARTVDSIVSNPPYVDLAERDSLQLEVRDHDPAVALFPPGDVLSVYRELVPAAGAMLRPGGALAVETSPSIAEAVRGLYLEAGFARLEVRNDLAGRARVVLGRIG
jgi:release factor glutamine methyltransferase